MTPPGEEVIAGARIGGGANDAMGASTPPRAELLGDECGDADRVNYGAALSEAESLVNHAA